MGAPTLNELYIGLDEELKSFLCVIPFFWNHSGGDAKNEFLSFNIPII